MLPLALSGALLSTTILTPVLAEEAKKAEEGSAVSLDTVTVYATKSPQSSFEVPAMTSNVDAEAPGTSMSGDISNVLDQTPGVEVQNGPRRNGESVSIRGFDDEAIVTLMDGRRQNFESGHDGRVFVDPSLLKRVEVVKGSSSAIYGGGAIGGVVAYETKDAKDMLEPGQNWGVYTSAGYRSANEEYSPVVSAYGRTGKWDIIGIAALRNSGNIEQGDGNELVSDDNMISGTFKAGYTFNDYNTVKVIYQGLNDDSTEPNNPGGAVGVENPVVDKEIHDNQIGLKYEYDNPANNLLKPKLHLYYNNTRLREADIAGSNAGRVQNRTFETLGFTAENQMTFNPSDTQKHVVTFGSEIYRDAQVGNTTNGGTRPGVPNADATNSGVFVQDEMTFTTEAGKFLIIPAARFDNYRSSDDAGNSQNESKISPKISASYLPNDNLMFFGSVAQAFRAPNLTEIYASGQHFPAIPPMFPANFFTPNPDLRPETVITYEAGMGVKFDGVFDQADKMSLKGSWFLSEGDDFISETVDIFGGTTQFINIPNARLTGFEIDGEYRLHPIRLKTGLSYVEAENTDTGEYLSNSVPLTFLADLGYSVDSIDSIVGVRGRFAAADDKIESSDVETAGYAVWDVYYRWQPSEPALKNLTLDLGVSNILDKEYIRAGSSLVDEGRSYNIRLAYKW